MNQLIKCFRTRLNGTLASEVFVPWHTPVDSSGTNVHWRQQSCWLFGYGLATKFWLAQRTGPRPKGNQTEVPKVMKVPASDWLDQDWRSRVFDFLAGDPLPVSEARWLSLRSGWCLTSMDFLYALLCVCLASIFIAVPCCTIAHGRRLLFADWTFATATCSFELAMSAEAYSPRISRRDDPHAHLLNEYMANGKQASDSGVDVLGPAVWISLIFPDRPLTSLKSLQIAIAKSQ